MTTTIALVGLDWDAVELVESIPDTLLLGVFAATKPDGEINYLGDDVCGLERIRTDPQIRTAIAVDIPSLRRKLCREYGKSCITLVSPHARVSRRCSLGDACIVQRDVAIMPLVRIGNGVKLNDGCVIHHECIVGDYSTVAPGARLLGRVHLGEEVFVGSEATVLPRCRIGSGATIGAGAVIVRDVPAGATVVGVPGRVVRQK